MGLGAWAQLGMWRGVIDGAHSIIASIPIFVIIDNPKFKSWSRTSEHRLYIICK